MAISFEYRDMTDVEFEREKVAFNEHGLEFGNAPETEERHGFVATDSGKFVGCSSGLAQKTDDGYNNYFFLTDLLVEKEYRKKGYGKKLLSLLEGKIKELGITYIWTWTADYEAPKFYLEQGYKTFVTFKDWYSSGHARVGLKKKL